METLRIWLGRWTGGEELRSAFSGRLPINRAWSRGGAGSRGSYKDPTLLLLDGVGWGVLGPSPLNPLCTFLGGLEAGGQKTGVVVLWKAEGADVMEIFFF